MRSGRGRSAAPCAMRFAYGIDRIDHQADRGAYRRRCDSHHRSAEPGPSPYLYDRRRSSGQRVPARVGIPCRHGRKQCLPIPLSGGKSRTCCRYAPDGHRPSNGSPHSHHRKCLCSHHGGGSRCTANHRARRRAENRLLHDRISRLAMTPANGSPRRRYRSTLGGRRQWHDRRHNSLECWRSYCRDDNRCRRFLNAPHSTCSP